MHSETWRNAARDRPRGRRAAREAGEAATSWPIWGRVFAGVGLLATLLTLLGLFSAVGRRPAETWTAAPGPAVGTAAFRDALAGAVNAPVREGGRAELLSNGVEFVPALLEAIEGAEASVNWMAYVWRPGAMSDLVLDALLAAARRGVEVRVMLDGHGAQDAPGERFEALEAAGAHVVTFRPLRLSTLERFHKRNHRRAIVMDGRVAFTGGAAVADTWLGDARHAGEWRDDMVRVTGPLARSVQAAFAQLWAGTSGEILVGGRFYPEAAPAATAGEPIARHVGVVSSPSSENHPLRKIFYLSFAGARERIWITNPYFVPDPEVLEILVEQARRGVDVRLLTAGEHTDLPLVRWAAQSFYTPLLDAGARVYEFRPSLHHAKNLVVDRTWSVVGSANLDVRSKELNEENVLGIEDRRFNEALAERFLTDLERSDEVRLEAWRERGAWPRVRERVASLFEEQL